MALKLEKWALVAEIVGSLAVVVTLIFLILEVRESTAVNRVSAYERHLTNVNSVMELVIQDEQLSRIYRIAGDGPEEFANLTVDERERYWQLMRALYRAYETAYFARKADLLGQSEWSRFERLSCFFRERETKESWEEFFAVAMGDEFLSYLDTLCEPFAER